MYMCSACRYMTCTCQSTERYYFRMKPRGRVALQALFRFKRLCYGAFALLLIAIVVVMLSD